MKIHLTLPEGMILTDRQILAVQQGAEDALGLMRVSTANGFSWHVTRGPDVKVEDAAIARFYERERGEQKPPAISDADVLHECMRLQGSGVKGPFFARKHHGAFPYRITPPTRGRFGWKIQCMTNAEFDACGPVQLHSVPGHPDAMIFHTPLAKPAPDDGPSFAETLQQMSRRMNGALARALRSPPRKAKGRSAAATARRKARKSR